MRILVVEDEKKTAAFLAKGLREAGFAVDVAPDGETGSEQARAKKFDLLIVDIMLPHKDGWQMVAELRRDRVRTPILFLTARDSVRDRVKGLELGADDYLVNRSRLRNCSHGCARYCDVLPSDKQNICKSLNWKLTCDGTRQCVPE